MLSKKLTFSLASLVMVIALGFAFTPTVLAAIDTEPEVSLDVADVSSAAGRQIEAYDAISDNKLPTTYDDIDTAAEIEAVDTTNQTGDVVFYLKIKNEGVASLDSRSANIITPVPDPNPCGYTAADPPIASTDLHIHDLSIQQFDKLGIMLTACIKHQDSMITHRSDAVRDGRNFQVTIASEDINDNAIFMIVKLPAGAFQHAAPADVRAAHFDPNNSLKTNKESEVLRIELVKREPTPGNPMPVSLVRVADTATRGPDQGGMGVFSQAVVSGPFKVKATFTEEPNGAIEDIIDVKRGKITHVVKGTPFYLAPDMTEGNYPKASDVPLTTGRDRKYYSYLLDITPNFNVGDETVEVAVKGFDDMVLPPNRWAPPANLSLAHNRYLLIVPVDTSKISDIFKPSADAKASNEIFIPDGLVIPAGGYLVLTQGTEDQSGVTSSPLKIADKKAPGQEFYNIKYEVNFPYPGADMADLFRNGGTLRLLHSDVAENKPAEGKEADENGYLPSNTSYAAGSVVISEIMWGLDFSLGDANAVKSQWIELHNPGPEAISIDKNEWTLAFYQGSAGTAGADLIDEVSNASPIYWPVPGSNGATEDSLRFDVLNKAGTEIVGTAIEEFEIITLQSMYRKIDGTNVMTGTSGDSWAASTIAGSLNIKGFRAGTPGAATPYTTPAEPPPEPTPKAPVATGSDIMISEVMVASNEGRLPQWIELANVSGMEVSLMGWSVDVDNDPADADVIAESVNVTIGDVTVGKDQVVLVVTKTGRNSGVGTGTGDLRTDRIVNVRSQISPTDARYSLISESAFKIALLPPQKGGVVERGDVVGNLGMGWELPMSEGSRSSLIRREMGDAGEIMGTDAAGWVLASNTALSGAYRTTYYGDDEDEGTPGYDAGGALPVELSMFTAARDRVTGQVVITWETQSELNNAGFFIKRSQQQVGEFVIVNPTMIAGAGTTGEKQSYTYTDTTAKPNIVYYYQIEDVSLDGNHQTLTRAHRLKGHIGAAGKLTTLWGTLKAQD